MRIAFFLATFALILITVASSLSMRTAHAGTCLMRDVPDPLERLDLAAGDDWVRIVLMGVVTEELRMERDYGALGEYHPARDQSGTDRSGIFQSTVRVDAVLKGEVPGEDFVLQSLSEEWLCSSGPLLPKGQRVLLLLGQWPRSPTPANPRDFSWQTSVVGGQVFFTDGEAFMADYQAAHGDTSLGRAEDVVVRVAQDVRASEEATQAALAALQSPLVEGDDDGRRWVAVVASVVTVLACGVAILWMRRSMRRA